MTSSVSPQPLKQSCRQNSWARTHLKKLHAMEKDAEPNATFYFNDLLRFFPPVFPLKSVMAKQNLQSWSLDIKSTFSPECCLFIKHVSFQLKKINYGL